MKNIFFSMPDVYAIKRKYTPITRQMSLVAKVEQISIRSFFSNIA
jgi:hypothetical protein